MLKLVLTVQNGEHMSTTCKPSLKTLQEFVNSFFRKDTPKVEWFNFKDSTLGMAYTDPKHNRIQIKPSMPRIWHRCSIGHLTSNTPAKQFNFLPGELYFFVLLHEIGHFKIERSGKFKPPRYFESLKKRLQNEFPGNFDRQFYNIESHMKQRKRESDTSYLGRLTEFESYFEWGETYSSHAAVDDWARDEFEKRRSQIAQLIHRRR